MNEHKDILSLLFVALMCGCGLWICECMRAAHVCIGVSHDIGSDIPSTDHLVMREFVSGPPGHHS